MSKLKKLANEWLRGFSMLCQFKKERSDQFKHICVLVGLSQTFIVIFCTVASALFTKAEDFLTQIQMGHIWNSEALL